MDMISQVELHRKENPLSLSTQPMLLYLEMTLKEKSMYGTNVLVMGNILLKEFITDEFKTSVSAVLSTLSSKT